ncbi:phytanoyl-CoA dioxygenase family protein [Neotabrizicola shimadae]|uniref:Phytanoyl-CoA dioxygenase family protein n=2 Tax=Neotabrizicola shimadae TaxID=2807096 RepID=A0A8G1EFC3_9RHOB|nr:phytanoyl-CoA dioxygenase family protein [Neotabrizicola shimadae]
MNSASSAGLGPDHIDQFIRQGYVALEGAFDPADAAEGRALLWQAMGLAPDNAAGWTRPVLRVGFRTDPPFVRAANTPRLHAAFNQLAGAGRWLPPPGLGTFPVRFPVAGDPGDLGWHVDPSFGTEDPDFLRWRVNVKSRGRALLMLFLLSDTGPQDGPTRLRAGSHQHIARQLLPRGEEGMTLGELATDDFATTASCAEVQATGPAGTVFLCHPFLVHAAQPVRGPQPRFLAQPALLPRFGFDPALPPSPVQIAIRQACGL